MSYAHALISLCLGQQSRIRRITEEFKMRRRELEEIRMMTEKLNSRDSRLREALSLIDGFFSNVSVGLALINKELHYLRTNKSYADLLGQPPEKLIGIAAPEVWPPLSPHIRDLIAMAQERGVVGLTSLKYNGEMPPRVLVVCVTRIADDGYGIILEDQTRLCDVISCSNRIQNRST